MVGFPLLCLFTGMYFCRCMAQPPAVGTLKQIAKFYGQKIILSWAHISGIWWMKFLHVIHWKSPIF